MKNRIPYFQRCSCFLLSLLLVAALLPVPAKAADRTPKVVRVGWYEDAYNITGKNGQRSGYAYEYEQSVAAYTGWTYEYVAAGWSDLFEMMKNGDIDLMAGISYTDERAQDMLFSELPMGQEKYYLYANLRDTDISASDLTTLNGKNIALMKGSVHADYFYQWEAAHGLHLNYVWVDSFEQGKQQAADHEIDCVVSTETPDWVAFGMSAIASVGGSNIYFAINKNRPDLKEELDSAMRKMDSDKPFYSDELYQRYLAAVYTPVLDTTEQSWLKRHGHVRVGYLNSDGGLSSLDPMTHKLEGVLTDYVRFARDNLNNDLLDFELVGFDSMDEEIQALKNGTIDFIFHFTQNPYIAEQNDFVLSNTVMSLSMAAVTTENYFNETTEMRVAVPKDDLLVQWYISYNYPDWDVMLCDTAKEAEKAVRSGKADCFLVESGTLSQYTSDKSLHSVILMQSGNIAFAINRGDVTLMSILNKTLRTIPSSLLTGALATYESSMRTVTLVDYIKDNLLTVALVLFLLLSIVMAVILNFLNKSLKAEAAAKQAAETARELNETLQKNRQELQTALQAAETASKAKTDFLANMSHDIRTPMNAIVGLTSLMENDLNDPVKLSDYLGKLKASSQHLLNLINEILDMNKIESGKATLHVTPFCLADQVTQIDSVIRPQARARSQTFTIETHHIRHENMEGDATRLQQVLLNILSNAVKYTGVGGHIELTIEELPRDGHYARYKFTVADNGMGMSEEYQKHIFEPFTRAENSVTNKVQGTGLGMAITKSIVSMMGGAISFTSTLNKGTTFEVILEFKIDQKADQAVKQMSLLLLRCSDKSFARIQSATENSPVSIYRTTGPAETEALLKTNHYDVVLMPCALYGDDLPAAVKKVRALAGPDTLLLGSSTLPREEALDRFLRAGLDGYLPMPFFLSNLEAEVARVREHRASGDPQEKQSVLRGMRFLCAEDNALNAEILEAMLEAQGASCTLCQNGAEIVEKFRTVQPGDYDAILMDVQMPVMDGYDATRAIRSGPNPLGRTIPIIAMTANAFAEDVQKSFDAGMDSHLSKPVDMAVLEQTLRKFRRTPPPERKRME